MHGGAHSWISNSNVERYLAESKKNMVIVMPEMGNDFYTDQAIGWKYFTYVAEELPRVVQSFLRISSKREDTYAAGLSMGGYGAMKLALTYPEKFCYAASFSGALDVYDAMQNNDPHLCEYLFGGADKIPGSVNDLFYLLKQVDEQKKQKPELYVSCGSADKLFESNGPLRTTGQGTGVCHHPARGNQRGTFLALLGQGSGKAAARTDLS